MYDENEEINRLIDEAADEYLPLNEILDQIGMTFAEALSEAEKYRARFFGILSKYGIDRKNINDICTDAAQLIKREKNDDTLFLYAALLSEVALLFDNITDDEQKIRLWLDQQERSEYLIERIRTEDILRERFAEISTHIPKNADAGFDPSEQSILYDISNDHPFISNNIGDIYYENLGELIRKVSCDPLYSKIKPYIYSAVISSKHKMMLTRAHYSPNISSVFKHTEYKIYKNNGKNFNTYKAYIELYAQLRFCYENKSDIALSDYCFANLSNLSEWFHMNYEYSENVPMDLRQIIVAFAHSPELLTDEDINREILVNVSEYL